MFIRLFAVGQIKEIVGRSLIQPCQADKNIGGQVPQTSFISAVLRLFDVEIIGYLLLRKIVVFPKVSQPWIVVVHPATSYNHLVLTDYHILC